MPDSGGSTPVIQVGDKGSPGQASSVKSRNWEPRVQQEPSLPWRIKQRAMEGDA